MNQLDEGGGGGGGGGEGAYYTPLLSWPYNGECVWCMGRGDSCRNFGLGVEMTF